MIKQKKIRIHGPALRPVLRSFNEGGSAAKKGLTLIELMVASAMATICVLAVGAVFSDSQKAWNQTYIKANSSIMLDSHLASKAFEATIRKASCERYLLDPAGQWVEVYYFASDASTTTDRYAYLHVENNTFYIDHGTTPSPRQQIGRPDPSPNPICENVDEDAFSFSGSGRCIRLDMTLSNNDSDVRFFSSAVPQNQ
jgi:Tfp pilus assembly protein PilE